MLEAAAIVTLGVLAVVLVVIMLQVVSILAVVWAVVGGLNFVGGLVVLSPVMGG